MAYSKILASSANKENLSLTLKAFVPLVLLLVSYFKIDLAEGEIDQAINAIASVAVGLIFLKGLVRKVIIGFKEKE